MPFRRSAFAPSTALMPQRAVSAALLLSTARLSAAEAAPPVWETGGYAASYQSWLGRTGKLHKHGEDQRPAVHYERSLHDHRLRRRPLPQDPLQPRSAQAALQLRTGSGLQQPGYVAPYTPKIGVANVTTPTELPPPPPVLEYDRDYQPLDTWIGNSVATQFVAPMTVTPPPTQSAIDLAFSCPELLAFPDVVRVDVYGSCDAAGSTTFATSGNW